MKLQEIVKGANPLAQQALDSLFANIKEERILWYPSAGGDFRDLLETLSPERRALHGLSEAPNIFIHTTYIRDYVNLNVGVIRNDGRTVVEVQEKHQILIKDEIDFNYEVSSQFAEFRDYASVEPLIHLVKLRLNSNILGTIEGWLFYFHFENHNFLQEIILKQQLRISHLVKVREGLGFGGNRQSITLVYALLANIGVRYLLADDEIQFFAGTHDYVAKKFAIDHQAFTLIPTGQEIIWSEFGVLAYKVEPLNRSMQHDDLLNVLSTITPRYAFYKNKFHKKYEPPYWECLEW